MTTTNLSAPKKPIVMFEESIAKNNKRYYKDVGLTKGNITYKKPRALHTNYFTKHSECQYSLLNAATGAGKSFAIVMKVIHHLTNNPTAKAIIVVPYKDIANGFTSNDVCMPDGKCYNITPAFNLALNDFDKSKDLIAFIKDDANITSINNRIIVCTYQNLISAHKQLGKEHFSNLFVAFDEAHHSKFEDDVCNRTGKVLNDLIEDGSNHIMLTTATFMRSDRFKIIPEKYRLKFEIHKYSFAEFLADSQYLKHYKMAISICATTDSIVNRIVELYKADKNKNTIIWIPHTNQLKSTYGIYDKHDLVRRIKDAIKSCGDYRDIKDYVDDDNSEFTLKDFNGTVIAMNKFKEGSNWVEAERGIIIGQRESLVDMIQMIGRLFRDCKNKEKVTIEQILSIEFSATNTEELRDNVNNYYKAINACMLLEDIFKPVSFRGKNAAGERREYKNYLMDVCDEEVEKFQEVWDDISKSIISIGAAATDKKVNLEEEIKGIAADIIDRHELDTDVMSMCQYIIRRFSRINNKKPIGNSYKTSDIDCNFLSAEMIETSVHSIDIGAIDLEEYKSVLYNYTHFKSNTSEFIKNAIKTHGDKYNYNKVNYINSNKKVIIICKIHGNFEQIARNHLLGFGCAICSNKIKSNTSEFIKKAITIHHNKYDYSKVNYVASNKKIIIICKKHGVFEQTPHDHFSGRGCIKCSGKIVFNTSEFIEEAGKIHNYKYNYSKVNYIESMKKVIIICNDHGKFEQIPSSHLIGRGCPTCSNNIKSNTTEFIQKAMKIHGNKFNYDKVNYIEAMKKIIITCKIHGDFEQLPSSHLRGRGCKNCYGNHTSTTIDFIKKAIKTHKSKYDYSKVNYINARTKIIIICKIHGEFEQNANNHLRGSGCKYCIKEKK